MQTRLVIFTSEINFPRCIAVASPLEHLEIDGFDDSICAPALSFIILKLNVSKEGGFQG